jgi:hypothetical protein
MIGLTQVALYLGLKNSAKNKMTGISTHDHLTGNTGDKSQKIILQFMTLNQGYIMTGKMIAR